MICSNCGRDIARIYKHTTAEGREVELKLCPTCYADLYEDGDPELYSALSDGTENAVCPLCGASMQDFRKDGLVGCAYCYKALRYLLLPSILRYQGTTYHTGEHPDMADDEKYDLVRNLITEREQLLSKLRAATDGAEAEKFKERLKEVDRILGGGEV